jgi:hypothetical protein
MPAARSTKLLPSPLKKLTTNVRSVGIQEKLKYSDTKNIIYLIFSIIRNPTTLVSQAILDTFT